MVESARHDPRMFLIPLAKKFDWRRPPVVTFLIVLVNVLVYAVWQSPSQDRREQALVHYFESSLAELELPRYARYLAQRQRPERAALVQRAMAGSERDMVEAVYEWGGRGLPTPSACRTDRATRSGVLAWRARERSIPLAEDRTGSTLSSPPWRAPYMLTHMFMHADWGHLIGNMIVLVVGFVVEQVLAGAFLCSTCGGFGAAAAFCASTTSHPLWGLGRSGVMYAAIFGLRKINFFYFVWVYFDYVKASAIVLLVVWLVNEIFQQAIDKTFAGWGRLERDEFVLRLSDCLDGRGAAKIDDDITVVVADVIR
jgi:membrane associated rhomboid family serine protease